MNLIDKTIGYFNPKIAFERQQYRNAINLLGGFGTEYDSTTPGAHYNIEVFDNTADDDISDIRTARATARKYYNNNGFYEGVINSATDHVIGSGLKPKSTILETQTPTITPERIKVIEKVLDNYFNLWSESTICDITGKDNFNRLQRLAYESYKIDGDSFSLLPLTTIRDQKVLQINQIDAQFIQSIEADFYQGIKTSKEKMPVQYSILQEDNTYKKVSAFKNGKRNVLHVFNRKRPKQLRGLPFLNSVTRDIVYINDLMQYELTASKLAAIFFGSITTAAKDSAFGNNQNLLSKPGEQEQTTQNTVKENSITQLQPGDELKIHTQDRDNPNFEQFIKTCLLKVSSKTRIPLEILLAQFVSSYSASRAAMLQMQKFVKPERELFVTSYCNPIRNQVLTWAILSGQLNIPEFATYGTKLFRAKWIGEAMGSVDPGKDIKAFKSAVDANFKTHEESTTELGFGDFDTNMQTLKEEHMKIAELNKIKGVENNAPKVK